MSLCLCQTLPSARALVPAAQARLPSCAQTLCGAKEGTPQPRATRSRSPGAPVGGTRARPRAHAHARTHARLGLANLYGSCLIPHCAWGCAETRGGGAGGALPLTWGGGAQVSPSRYVCLPALVSWGPQDGVTPVSPGLRGAIGPPCGWECVFPSTRGRGPAWWLTLGAALPRMRMPALRLTAVGPGRVALPLSTSVSFSKIG